MKLSLSIVHNLRSNDKNRFCKVFQSDSKLIVMSLATKNQKMYFFRNRVHASSFTLSKVESPLPLTNCQQQLAIIGVKCGYKYGVPSHIQSDETEKYSHSFISRCFRCHIIYSNMRTRVEIQHVWSTLKRHAHFYFHFSNLG